MPMATAHAPREALRVLCLVSPSLASLEEWIPDDEPDLTWFNQPRKPLEHDPDWSDQSPQWKAPEVPLDDGRILVLEYT